MYFVTGNLLVPSSKKVKEGDFRWLAAWTFDGASTHARISVYVCGCERKEQILPLLQNLLKDTTISKEKRQQVEDFIHLMGGSASYVSSGVMERVHQVFGKEYKAEHLVYYQVP